MGGLGFQCDDSAVRSHCAGEPNGAVANQCADLENVFRPLHARQKVKEFSLTRRDADLWQTGGDAGFRGRAQNVVFRNDGVSDVLIDGGPEIECHSSVSPGVSGIGPVLASRPV